MSPYSYTISHTIRHNAGLIWALAVFVTVVELAPLKRHEYNRYFASSMRSLGHLKKYELSRHSRNLGEGEITKLLNDLDNQTEAMKSGQEIGDELLGRKIKPESKERQQEEEKQHSSVTDSTAQEVSIPQAPILEDATGVPQKTTAAESGAAYLTGNPVLVVNSVSNNAPDVGNWFLYYPLHTERDDQLP